MCCDDAPSYAIRTHMNNNTTHISYIVNAMAHGMAMWSVACVLWRGR